MLPFVASEELVPWLTKKLVQDVLLPGGAWGIRPDDGLPKDKLESCCWNELISILNPVLVVVTGKSDFLLVDVLAVVRFCCCLSHVFVTGSLTILISSFFSLGLLLTEL